PVKNVNSNRLAGVARPSQTIAAKIADIRVYADSLTMRNLRMSRMSASAPAGIATRNMGSVVATCTSDTMSGSGLRLVISQPEAALYIQLPTFATTVAVQITANAGCRNGLKGEPTFVEEEERLALISDPRSPCPAVAGSRASPCLFFGDRNRRTLAGCLGFLRQSPNFGEAAVCGSGRHASPP